MDEFSLIEIITTTLGARQGALGGVGDDATILDIPEDEQLVISTDTLVEGVHFEVGASPRDIGYKSLAVNLSDLAAMGARPGWFFLALTHPTLDEQWTRSFSAGLRQAAKLSDIQIAGGDTTHGPLSITITVCGLVRRGRALLRSGALAGEVIGISGATGLAALALQDLENGRQPQPACLSALYHPVPRLELGQALAGQANSCIDVSDGLVADLRHIAAASGVGMKVRLEDLPCPAELARLDHEDRWNLQLGGGDDYELCFTIPMKRWSTIEEQARAIGVPVSRIGEVTEGRGCECITPDGEVFQPSRPGYNHGRKSRP